MITFRTESGSVYTLDGDKWSSTSASTRTSGGPMFEHSKVEIGKPVGIVGPGLVTGTRLILTTPVVKIMKTENPA